MHILSTKSPHLVRCLAPNASAAARTVDQAYIATQVEAYGYEFVLLEQNTQQKKLRSIVNIYEM